MDKSPDAFRTISEVAEHLETPAHVLRFWETRFPQIRPVKRAGGRRYYRPADVALIAGIKHLLHDEGLTIRGVQKILREQGVRHVSGLVEDGMTEDADAEAALEAALAANFSLLEDEAEDVVPVEQAESATVIALQTALHQGEPETMARKEPAAKADTPFLFDFADPPQTAEADGNDRQAESMFKPPYTVSLPETVDLTAEDSDDTTADEDDNRWDVPDSVLSAAAPESAPSDSDFPDSDFPDSDLPDSDLPERGLPAPDAPAAAVLRPAEGVGTWDVSLPLPDRLRALPRTALIGNAAAMALHQRLIALQSRLDIKP